MWGPLDSIEADLGSLRTFDADPQTIERIRARCLATLVIRQHREQGLRSRFAAWRAWLEPAVAFGLGTIYLAAAFRSSLALLR